MALKPIRTGRLGDQVTEQLKQSMFDGEYLEGERLPSEHQLMEIFGVSRIVVREAVRNLEKAGLVEIKRGPTGGAFVRAMNHQVLSDLVRDTLKLGRINVAEIMEVRLHIEPIVAGLAAKRHTSKDLAMLERGIKNMPKVKNGNKYVAWNVDFHRLVAKASHNAMYELLVNILMDMTLELILSIKPSKRVLHDTTSHPAIVEKIRGGDVKGAELEFRKHLQEIVPMLEDLEKKMPIKK